MTSTRELIMRAATHLLDKGGPEAVTMRAVTEQIGLSHNASYSHFKDKATLLGSIAAKEFKKREMVWDEVAQGKKSFRAGINSYIQWACKFPERFYLTYGRWDQQSDELKNASRLTYLTYLRAVDRAQKDGKLPEGDNSRVGFLVVAFGNGAANLKLAGHFDQEGRKHQIKNLVDDFMLCLETADGR